MLNKYLKVYYKFIQLNISQLVNYRASFYGSLIGSVVWGSFHFISIFLLTSRTKSFFGWNRDELIILTGAYTFFWGIFHVILAKNFNNMSRIIDYAKLDMILTKPVNSQFYLSLSNLNLTGFFRIILGIVVLIFMIIKTHIAVSILNIVGFVTLGLFGLVLMYSFWFMTSTLMIWYPRLSNLIDLLYNISGIIKQPPEMILQAKNQLVFILLPLILVITTPTKLLINKVIYGDIYLLLFFSVVFLYLSSRFWKFALKFYTSASG